jgi:hypothetical protein
MPDRVIRDELLDSERWLWLPNDTDRLVYIGLLLKCDDFGNLEGGQRRIFRMLHAFTQIKTEEATATSLLHLLEADLIRRYEVEGRELYHLPRFKAGRDYLVRRVPESPWCPPDALLGKHKRLYVRGLAKNMSKDSGHVSKDSQHVLPGVGVGVGVGVIKKAVPNTYPPEAVDNSNREPDDQTRQTWAEHWTAQGKAFGIIPKQGETTGDYCRRVIAMEKSKPV